MINSIELTDWKTHGSTRLEFSKGTNILIGQMGAGGNKEEVGRYLCKVCNTLNSFNCKFSANK